MSTGIIIMERRNKFFVFLQVLLLLWKLRNLTLERKIITFKI